MMIIRVIFYVLAYPESKRTLYAIVPWFLVYLRITYCSPTSGIIENTRLLKKTAQEKLNCWSRYPSTYQE